MIAVLLLAYGGPLSLDDVEPYLLDVRHGRPVSREFLDEVRERYRLIGGRSPLLEITRRQAKALERRLNLERQNYKTFVGMRHWHPYIREAIQEIAAAEIKKAVALCMAPHFSAMSIGAYMKQTETARQAVYPEMALRFVQSWHLQPAYIRACAGSLAQSIAAMGGDDKLAVLFTAHSLPKRILSEGDPYPEQLRATVTAVCEIVKPKAAFFAYQSRAQSSEEWLGPDAGEEIPRLRAAGFEKLIIHPIGFVADHVEILYDGDILYRRQAEGLGFQFARVASCNDRPEFIEALSQVVLAQVKGW
ncbi:MAG TPA: ferrochelatase [Acidobacteriota bacterium]|jgi:ferrochelatase